MATITSLGVGSGLPLQDTLDKLAVAERQRLDPIKHQQTEAAQKKAAYGTLNNALNALQNAGKALNKADVYHTIKASSTNADIVVNASPEVAVGKYAVKVEQLATAQSLATQAHYPLTEKVNGKVTAKLLSDQDSSITISRKGHDQVIRLAKDQTSLVGIRDAINKMDAGISASLVKVDGDNYSLVMNVIDTGAENAITKIVAQGSASLVKDFSYPPVSDTDANSVKQLLAAQDAKLTVNGLEITRPSNIITDAPQGLTLTLNAKAEATVSVEKTVDDAKTAIKKWVDSYNSFLDTVDQLTKYTPVDPGAKKQSADNGPLLGDSTIMSMKTQIRSQFIAMGSHSPFKTLAQIGINTTDFTSGKLTIDDKKLDKALSSHLNGVSQFLAGDDKRPGVMGNIDRVINGYTSSTGSISNMERNIDRRQVDLQRQFNQVNVMVNATIANYKKQFSALDVLVKKMSDTSSYLTQQFDALTKSVGK